MNVLVVGLSFCWDAVAHLERAAGGRGGVGGGGGRYGVNVKYSKIQIWRSVKKKFLEERFRSDLGDVWDRIFLKWDFWATFWV